MVTGRPAVVNGQIVDFSTQPRLRPISGIAGFAAGIGRYARRWLCARSSNLSGAPWSSHPGGATKLNKINRKIFKSSCNDAVPSVRHSGTHKFTFS